MSTGRQIGLKVTISGCVGPGLIFEFTIDRRVVLLKLQLSHFYSLRAGLLVPLHPLETQIRHLENEAHRYEHPSWFRWIRHGSTARSGPIPYEKRGCKPSELQKYDRRYL